MNEICFQQDTAERKRWFRSASFAHPAKMHLSLQFYLIEHYTKIGDTILDPMTGSGTVLVACALGRNVICVELEEKFIEMQKDNWEKIKALGPILGYKMGQAVILQGDARNLDNVLSYYAKATQDKADCAIFSPPYAKAEAQLSADKVADPEKFAEISSKRFEQGKKKGHFASKEAILRSMKTRQKGCGENPNNISNLPYGKISAVISSPPYEATFNEKQHTVSGIAKRDPKMRKEVGGYSSNKRVDVVCTSPPYEQSLTDGHAKKRTDGTSFGYTDVDESIKRLREHGRTDDKAGGPYGRSLGHPYSGAVENIGNLKSENYLEAMLLVYQNCFRVLRPEGLMILVVKNFIRDKKIVQLDLDTIKLCEQAGFTLTERLKRKLTQMSFWRRIYQQKYPDAPTIDFEDVLVFKKGLFE